MKTWNLGATNQAGSPLAAMELTDGAMLQPHGKM